MYHNGTQQGTMRTDRRSLGDGSGRMVIGKRFADDVASYLSSVQVAGLTFWNRDLTPAEVDTLFNYYV